MDFLGLKTLTVIRNTVEMVKAARHRIPIDNLPLDNAKAYNLLNKGNTVGMFQLESGGMRDLCRKFQISSVEHITALVALAIRRLVQSTSLHSYCSMNLAM